jgi:hypothetical protein
MVKEGGFSGARLSRQKKVAVSLLHKFPGQIQLRIDPCIIITDIQSLQD